jgi:hypothetical protein
MAFFSRPAHDRQVPIFTYFQSCSPWPVYSGSGCSDTCQRQFRNVVFFSTTSNVETRRRQLYHLAISCKSCNNFYCMTCHPFLFRNSRLIFGTALAKPKNSFKKQNFSFLRKGKFVLHVNDLNQRRV